MRPRLLMLLVLVAGCGRIGFGASADRVDAALDQDALVDAPPDAAIPTCASDGLCAALCMTMDPDCTTTCGDGNCLGNAGELCGTCAADCATRQPVCGNGACDPGEAAAACYADCGPAPWTWPSEEAAVLTLINDRRTAGFQCPGQTLAITAPPLTLDLAIALDAREWVWEIAHQNIRLANGDVCNGRTWPERMVAGNYVSFVHAFGAGITPAGALGVWSADASTCERIMNPTRTVIGIGAAHDVEEAYVLLFR